MQGRLCCETVIGHTICYTRNERILVSRRSANKLPSYPLPHRAPRQLPYCGLAACDPRCPHEGPPSPQLQGGRPTAPPECSAGTGSIRSRAGERRQCSLIRLMSTVAGRGGVSRSRRRDGWDAGNRACAHVQGSASDEGPAGAARGRRRPPSTYRAPATERVPPSGTARSRVLVVTRAWLRVQREWGRDCSLLLARS